MDEGCVGDGSMRVESWTGHMAEQECVLGEVWQVRIELTTLGL